MRKAIAETRRKFDRDFKEGGCPETGRPIAEVARDLGINKGIRGELVNADRLPHARSGLDKRPLFLPVS